MKFELPEWLPGKENVVNYKWVAFSTAKDGFRGWLLSNEDDWKDFFNTLDQMGHHSIVIIPTKLYRKIADFLFDAEKKPLLFVFDDEKASTKITYKFLFEDLTELSLTWYSPDLFGWMLTRYY